jgi:hypothetical protein
VNKERAPAAPLLILRAGAPEIGITTSGDSGCLATRKRSQAPKSREVRFRAALGSIADIGRGLIRGVSIHAHALNQASRPAKWSVACQAAGKSVLVTRRSRRLQARRGDNGSAFFFRLRQRAKSAMVEILVSDLCDLSPALLGGHFSLGRHRQHATPSEDLNRSQPDVSTRADFRLFRLFCALFFPLFFIVSVPAAFLSPSQALAL